MMTSRADVLRFLPIGSNGKRLVNSADLEANFPTQPIHGGTTLSVSPMLEQGIRFLSGLAPRS